MANENIERHVLMTPIRLLWPALIEPKPERTVKGELYPGRYEAKFLFDAENTDWESIKALLGNIAMAAVGRVENLTWPMERGDDIADKAKAEGKDREFLRGLVVLTAHSNITNRKTGEKLAPPKLYANTGGQYVQFGSHNRASAEEYFYSGVFVKGELSFMGYTGMGGGVTCFVNEVVSLNYGERIGGADLAAKYGPPTAHVGKVSSENPTSAPAIKF